jgi:DNA primase
LVYHKGDLFFGLDSAKEDIKKQEQAILVEGEFDAISMFKEGIKNVVAVKGTAVTENQVALLARFTPKVTLCLDRDNAGFEAIKRSLASLEKKGVTTTVIVPNGKDPDEAIKADPIEFKRILKKDLPVYDFLLEKTFESNDKENVTGKKKIIDDLLPFFAQIENEVIKEHYLKKLSKELDSSFESLEKEIEKLKTGKKEDKFTVLKREKRLRLEVLEEYLMAILVQNNEKDLIDLARNSLKDYEFINVSYEKILEKIEDISFIKNVPKELSASYDKLYLLPQPTLSNMEEKELEIKKCSLEMLNLYLKDKIKKLSEEVNREKIDLKRKNLEEELNKSVLLLSKYK